MEGRRASPGGEPAGDGFSAFVYFLFIFFLVVSLWGIILKGVPNLTEMAPQLLTLVIGARRNIRPSSRFVARFHSINH